MVIEYVGEICREEVGQTPACRGTNYLESHHCNWNLQQNPCDGLSNIYVRDAPWQVADLRDNLALEQGKSTYMFRLDEVIPSFHFPKG